jgi:probable HAF family extracellular repeat protein
MGLTERLLGAAAAVLMATTVASGQGSIASLGLLPGATTSSAHGVSDGGEPVVVGGSYFYMQGNMAFRWTPSQGMQALGLLPGATGSFAAAVNADGSVVVGGCDFPNGTQRAFRWTAAGMSAMGDPPGVTGSYATAVSADGTVVVGSCGTSAGGWAFRWTAQDGMVVLGTIPGGTYSDAKGVSADGTVVAGHADTAFRWTLSDGMQALPLLPGHLGWEADGISADGLVVVGWTNSSMIRWSSSSGVEDLGHLPGRAQGFAADAVGSALVGRNMGNNGDRGLLWTRRLGLVDLNEYLPSVGVDMGGWTIQWAIGISADSRYVVGYGWNASNPYSDRALLITLPFGPGCEPADFNHDGTPATDADIEAFFACIAGNCCSTCDPYGADFDGDGSVATDADIEAFFRVIAGGSC